MEFRILDILSRGIGNVLSINRIAKKVRSEYGSGDYKNIYVAINNMSKRNIVKLEQAGNASLVSINFENYMIIDLLSEMELRKKGVFLQNRTEMQILLLELDEYVYNLDMLQSVSIIEPERNAKLNKADFLVQLKKSDNHRMAYAAKTGIYKKLYGLQMIHDMRINVLVLEDGEFSGLVKANEANPVREMLHDKIVISGQQGFWASIRNEFIKGTKIKVKEGQTHPAKIPEDVLVYNLVRFGYTEFGPVVKEAEQVCIEYTIAAIIFQKDERRMDAIPVILAKNTKKTSYDLLLFISRKYGFAGKILGILKSLRNLVVHARMVVEEPIKLLEAIDTEEVKPDEKRMRDRLRLYHVTR
ncbi:MAG: hypothetical protein KGI33_10020 [Thaumarchaeota archaeon]|nr:hypothetical protein [Nitrososphaerota archaeon]